MATTLPDPGSLFGDIDAERVSEALRAAHGELLAGLDADLTAALRGSDTATRRYVRDYRQLTARVVSAARVLDAGTSAGTVDVRPRPSQCALALLVEDTAAQAPFGPWAARFAPGDAAALEVISRVRELLGLDALPAPAAPVRVDIDERDAERFVRRVRAHLNHPDDEPPLTRLTGLFKLSKTELGGLFGVSRQAIDHWLAHGVPTDRQEKLTALLALADLLEAKLKPDRVPGVARRPAAAYNGRSMLEMVAADRHRELLDSVRGSFDWSTGA